MVEDELLRVQQCPEDILQDLFLFVGLLSLLDGCEKVFGFLRCGFAGEGAEIEGFDDLGGRFVRG